MPDSYGEGIVTAPGYDKKKSGPIFFPVTFPYPTLFLILQTLKQKIRPYPLAAPFLPAGIQV